MRPAAAVTAISTTPVKSLHIERREQARIEADGIRGDRRLLVLERGRMVNGKQHAKLQQVRAEIDSDDVLTLRFPDGTGVSGPLHAGEELACRFYSAQRPVRAVEGPFSAALSRHAGAQLRLVAPADGDTAVDRGREGAVTLVSRASVDALARLSDDGALDPLRFRMSVEIDGVAAFAEDAWLGRDVRVGGATLRVEGHVGRCLVTSRHPDTAQTDVPTLELLRELRGDARTTEPLALGVYASVRSPGTVSVGDAVAVLDPARS